MRCVVLSMAAVLLFGLASAAHAQNATQYNVLSASEDSPPSRLLTARLNDAALAAMERRAETYEALKKPEDIAAYQKKLKDFFVQQLGGFPERSPLNARVVGRGAAQGFRFEKVLFDSQPGHTVSGVLFLPEGEGPFPGVIVPCGHSANGKAADPYQRVAILLAMNGLAALCYDPIGQGERSQVLTPEGKPAYGSTLEHMIVGVGSILVGRNTATYRVWDGMRALDYLESRPDVDATRLGCTGNSGGGTLTSYIMALDERVKVAAPSCYLTTFKRLLGTIGPQDAEQNIFGQIGFGMDHPDYVIMRAPKPTLMCVATRDFFDIEGAWDNFRQNKRIYTRLGFPERMSLVETDMTHGFTTDLRVGAVRWMRRWLLEIDDAITEPDFPILTDEELLCTPKGQVMLLDGQRTVFDFNADEAARLAKAREAARKSPEQLRQEIRKLAAVPEWDSLPAARLLVGEASIGGKPIHKAFIETDGGIRLPGLLFNPAGTAAPCLYVSGEGKAAAAAADGTVAGLINAGHPVLAVDLSGFGELAPASTRSSGFDREFGTLWSDYYRAYLLGRSLVGIRAEEILLCAKAWGKSGVQLVAEGDAAVAALHAAALEPARIAKVSVHDAPYKTWTDVVSSQRPGNALLDAVHGALRVYDLPDLVTLAEIE